MTIGIEEIVFFEPEYKVPFHRLGKDFDLSDTQIKVYEKLYGFEWVPIAQKKMIDLIQAPVLDLLNRHPPESISYLIHARTSDYAMPFGESMIHILKTQCHLKETISFSVCKNNCSSTLIVLELLSHLLKENEKAMVVTGEISFSKDMRFVPNTSVTGDIAIAMVVSHQSKHHQVLAHHHVVQGRYAEGFWMNTADALDFEAHVGDYLIQCILTILEKNKMSLLEIKLILPHNINLLIWRGIAKKLSIPIEKIYLKTIAGYAHCFGADTILNLKKACGEQLLSPGDYYLMITVSMGAIFSAVLCRY